MTNSSVQPPITQTLHNIPAGWTTADTESQSLSRTSAGCTSGSMPKSEKGSKQPKPKRCKSCKNLFNPQRPLQAVCGPDCAIAIAGVRKRATEAKEARETARADKVKREKLKTRADWAREAQAAFNSWIRERDAGKPCISCQRHHGGQIHAGHYLSRGARPELAYEPDNCHAQCAPCNVHLSGNAVLYRRNLVELIGVERVGWLEGPHEPKRYTIDDLKTIRDTYRAKAKALKDNR